MLKSNEKSSKGKFFNKGSNNVSSWYGCGMLEHLLKHYPLIQNMEEKQRSKKKDKEESNDYYLER